MTRSSTIVVLAASLINTGCFSVMADIQAGAVSSTRFEDGRYGAALQTGGGLSIDDNRSVEHVGGGMSLRSKLAPDVQQLSFSPHVYYLHSSWVTPYGRAGVNLLQFERVDGDAAFGMLSPYGEVGMFFGTFVISGFAEYDLRFGASPNEPFVGIVAGIGSGVSTKGARDLVTSE